LTAKILLEKKGDNSFPKTEPKTLKSTQTLGPTLANQQMANFSESFATLRALAQLVERCTGIAEVMGLNPVYRGLNFTTAKVVYKCDNQSCLHISFAAQI